MNVADICPVGALTTKDFRFKVRVWFLDDVESVCGGCSNGCHIWASRSNNKVYRYLPRRNDSVNETWVCDEGRLSYRAISAERLKEPSVGGQPSSYPEALARAGELLRGAREAGARIVGVASPFAANEDLFVLRELLAALGAPPAVYAVPSGEADELLIKADKAPNAAGAAALGFERGETVGKAGIALVLGHSVPADAFRDTDELVLIDTHHSELESRASVVLPARHFSEKVGSFTNHAKRVQRFAAMVEPTWEAWAEGSLLQQIASAAGLDGWSERYNVRAVSKRLSENVAAFDGIHLDSLDDQGLELA